MFDGKLRNNAQSSQGGGDIPRNVDNLYYGMRYSCKMNLEFEIHPIVHWIDTSN